MDLARDATALGERCHLGRQVALRLAANVDSLEEYGLTNPAVVVTAEWKNGSTVYSMGEPTPFGDGYYLSLSGRGETIYTIASPLTAYGTAGN